MLWKMCPSKKSLGDLPDGRQVVPVGQKAPERTEDCLLQKAHDVMVQIRCAPPNLYLSLGSLLTKHLPNG